ncbi:MAG: hypothetical protein ACM3H9_01390 [Rhodospirillaceae bacterium]
MRRAAAVAVGVTLAFCGCAQRSAQPDVPALLTNPTVQSRAELARVVSEAMNGAPVTLADDALTASDTLIVERAVRRDAQDMNLRGRETGRPEHFRLVKSGSRCVLVHVGSGRRWTLSAATCSPR